MNTMHFQAMSALLCYPEQELIQALPEIRTVLSAQPELLQQIEPLLTHLGSGDMIALQENYVATFDRNPAHSLHLFEHIHGEDRARGQAMVDLMEEYKTHGFEMVSEELPDYVPLFLEFLSQCEPEVATPLLGDAVHVLNHVAVKLAESNSPYAGVLQAAVSLSPVTPEPLVTPPVRDMDEAMETFGPGVDGIEPLLKPTSAVAPINFYRQTPQPA
ncbi:MULTISPECIES: nitrate reductase molybdenum cofactor assembly chaperone [Brachymonas]|uniref:nitrate reductase molybdenum cofactor assembly chaperone n=1 Tax=Brachymonas TaxID=28219 RepID=UPI002E776F1A|nr:nitrate reductase molybdenum cofactor assembly chaperone [Brachymonas sp. J145]MEE1652399.1 nitrate reductase molybdenum cofactor assembly chaperone [Brachymonas sp. J145]